MFDSVGLVYKLDGKDGICEVLGDCLLYPPGY